MHDDDCSVSWKINYFSGKLKFLLNVCSNPNVYVKREKKKQSPYPSIKFYTNRKIHTGEELYFDYGYHPADPKTW